MNINYEVRNHMQTIWSIYANSRKILWFTAFLFYMAPSLGVDIVGRDFELKKIRQLLEKENFVTITGISGIGKTFLAKAFLEKNRNKYDIVWWFQEEEHFEANLINLGYNLNDSTNQAVVNSNYPPEVNLERIKAYLRNTHSKILFIFDNFFHIDDILSYIPNKSNFAFVVTSLNTFNNGKTIVLQKLPRADSIKLIVNKIKCTYHQAGKLARTLEDHPLALSQALAYIATRPGMDVNQYVSFYLYTLEKLWQQEENLRKDKIIDKTLYSTLSIVLDRLQKENTQGYQLMSYFAVYNKSIPKEVLERVYLAYISKEKIGIFEALASLKKYSLIEEDKNKNGITFSCHDSVFKALRIRLGGKRIKTITANVVEVFKDCFPTFQYTEFMEGSTNATFIHNKNLLNYLNYVSTVAKKQDVAGTDHILCILFHYYLFVTRSYEVASHFVNSLDEYYVHSKERNINKAYYHYLKGVYYAWRYTNYEKSNFEYTKAIKIMQKLPRLARAYKMYPLLFMAMNYCYMGDLEQAHQLIDEAKKDATDVPPQIVKRDNTFLFLATLTNLNIGQYQEALKYSVLGPAMLVVKKNEPLKPYHVEWIIMHSRILGRLGKFEKGYEILYKVYKSFENVVGTKEHDTYMTVCVALAELCRFKGDLIKMKTYLDELNSNLSKVYSEDETNCAEYYRLQGDYLFIRKEYNKALNSYLKAENVYSKIFIKHKHEDVRQLLKQLVKTCMKLEREVQYGHYLNIYRDVFGDQDLKELMSF